MSRERVYHGCDSGDTNGKNAGREVGGDLGWAHLEENVADSAEEVKHE